MIKSTKPPPPAHLPPRERAGFLPWHWSSPWFLSLLLALLTAAVYAPVARNDFVNYDDSDYVTANRHVTSGLKWENVVWAFSSGHASNWHPLTWLSHMMDCQLFGDHPAPMHLVNLIFHVLNTILLFGVLRRLTGALWPSAFVAALFGLHPLHVESVAWISERKDVLSTLFFLLTLAAYARYVEAREGRASRADRDGPPSDSPSSTTPAPRSHAVRSYALTLLLFALGLMTKPMLVTTPFVLLLLDYWPLRRFTSPAGQVPSPGGPIVGPVTPPGGLCDDQRPIWISRLGPLLLEKLPFFALSAASCAITFLVQRHGGAVSTSVSLSARLANAVVAYGRYIRKMFCPNDLSVLYPHPGNWPLVNVIWSAAALLAISALVVAQARARPYLLIGWLWFLGTLVPVIGLVQVGIQSMADRYTYVPMIGLFIMVTWSLAELRPDAPKRNVALAIGAGCSLLACSLLTIRQVGFWRDSEALFTRAVQVTKNNYLAYNNLGFYLSNHGRPAEALENYRRSLEINPNYEDALNNMGYALAGQKRFDQAISYYQAALRVRPDHVEVHNNLGNALSEEGKIDEAIQQYRFVLEKQADHADAHNNLGIALAMQGKLDEALPHFRDAIRYKPNYASAHSNLGNALAAQRKFAEATQEYQESLRLKPDDAQAHNNLGNVLAEQGRVAEAITNYTEAIRLNADNPEAHFNLALALILQDKSAEALAHLKEAVRLKPDYAAARQQLQALEAAPRAK
jgi:tetratricopeptide (TPR) repeat protein